MKLSKRYWNKYSIKIRLIVFPILIVMFVAIGITMLTNYNTKETLISMMGHNGIIMLEEFIQRIEDNTRSLEAINDSFDEHIRTVANAIMLMDDELNNDFLKTLAKELNVDELNIYSPEGVILYSNFPQNVGDRAEHLHSFFRSNQTELMEEIRKSVQSDHYYKYGIVKNLDGTAVQVGIEANTIKEITEQFEYQKLVENFAANDEIVYALFIDRNFKAIAHSEKDRIGLDLSNDPGAYAAIINGVEYTSEYLFGDQKIPVYDVVYPVVINGELLGAVNIGFSMVGVYETIRSNSANMSFWGAIAGFLIASILFTSSNYAVKTIDKLKGLMDSMARGDFTNKVPEILLKRKDEFGEISRSVDIMQNSISNIIRKVLGSSEDVASHSEELTATIEHSTAAAAEVAVVIEGIAGSANDQANDTENGLIAITELGNIIGPCRKSERS